LADGIEWAKASVKTVRGTVSSGWERTDDGLILEVGIPTNTTGTVVLPTQDWKNIRITEGGRSILDDRAAIESHTHIQKIKRYDDAVNLDIESGRYRFLVKRISGQ
jgi:alpha-L-rhamnosidase